MHGEAAETETQSEAFRSESHAQLYVRIRIKALHGPDLMYQIWWEGLRKACAEVVVEGSGRGLGFERELNARATQKGHAD